jgi:hypothetical protein
VVDLFFFIINEGDPPAHYEDDTARREFTTALAYASRRGRIGGWRSIRAIQINDDVRQGFIALDPNLARNGGGGEVLE